MYRGGKPLCAPYRANCSPKGTQGDASGATSGATSDGSRMLAESGGSHAPGAEWEWDDTGPDGDA